MAEDKIGPFDNEVAQELIEDLKEGTFDSAYVLPPAGVRSIEADIGQSIIAAAKIAAAPDDDLPEGLKPEQVAPLRDPQLKEQLREALDAVLADGAVSELYTHWARRGQVHEWKALSWSDLAPGA